ncbi:hypothetical protein ES319_A03G054100v1 [Gossypium barbadense]|uniref:Uncharacterized protein n=1 Tax=Gossypium barbadense TaxID=3634 RepID=A0A5J5WCL4_GOSBA|nr:hypothetical protein ES319_A03G054100v1 [Gossypium barbadense]
MGREISSSVMIKTQVTGGTPPQNHLLLLQTFPFKYGNLDDAASANILAILFTFSITNERRLFQMKFPVTQHIYISLILCTFAWRVLQNQAIY